MSALWLLALSLVLPEEGHTFFLDGQPFTPAIEDGRISVNGITLMLGAERECRFRSAREGVLLELPGGGTRWVGVRVERTYDGGLGFVDGLAPLSEAEVRGLWGLRVEVWNPSAAAKVKWLDASRVALTLGQSGFKEGRDLPELPPGLRYLDAMHFAGWRSLARLRDLEFLDVIPERGFDLRLIAGFPRLKVLHVGGGKVTHTEALATLPALEDLDLTYRDGVASVEFARSLSRLRRLDLRHTDVRDLSPLAGLTRLEVVDAHRTPVDRLPDGPLPSLRSLDLIGAPVTDEAVASFRRAHPAVRVRHRWNESLREALLGVTRVRVGEGEACGEEGAPAPYETSDAAEIAELMGLLVVDEQESGPVCGCLGGAEIEFFQGPRLLEATGLVCDSMLRWSGWPGDGVLTPANATALVEWLARRGATGPRDHIRRGEEREAASQRLTERAAAGMSPRLREVFESEGQAAAREPGTYQYRSFPARLAKELPAAADRIRLLLRILGADTGSWSGLDWQEQIAHALVGTYPRHELEAACRVALLGSDRQLRRGAARLWDSLPSPLDDWPVGKQPPLRSAVLDVLQESRSTFRRQRALTLVLRWWNDLAAAERERRLEAGLRDPSEPVRRQAMLVAGQAGATSSEALLLGVLRGAPVGLLALPSVPPDEEDAADDGDAIGKEASSAEIAGLALGYLRSRQALPVIEERATGGSAMLRVARALIDDRCDLVVADDFRTRDHNQALQLAAVESVVRCRGRHGLELALDYRQASHWWEPEQVAGDLKTMLLSADPPGRAILKAVNTLPELRGWYQQHGAEFLRRLDAH